MTQGKRKPDEATVERKLKEQARIRALRGKLDWQGDLDAMRRD